MHRERLMQDVSITWHSTNDSSSSSFSPRFSSRPSLSTRIHFREFSWEPHLHRHRCPQLQCLEPEEGAARSATPSQVYFANRQARPESARISTPHMPSYPSWCGRTNASINLKFLIKTPSSRLEAFKYPSCHPMLTRS